MQGILPCQRFVPPQHARPSTAAFFLVDPDSETQSESPRPLDYLSATLAAINMRIRQRRAPLGLLLLSSLAATSALASSLDSVPLNPATGSSSKIGTKDAPVDGKDGRPHEGPFVEVEHLTSGSDLKKLPPLEGRPTDPTIVDGVKIPQTNDGVMNDPDRSQAKEGTTGTSGGVSEKDQVRKAKEGATGEKAENKPESPKEAPPLPHSEQEKILSKEDATKDKSKPDGKTEDFSGLEVRATTI